MKNDDEREEHNELECSDVGQRGRGMDKTGDKKRKVKGQPQEEARQVLQKVSSFDESTWSICGMEGTETSQAREAHVHKQSVFRNLSKYDVFLNHRGADLKKTFVSHLAAAILRAGHDPFLDAKALVKGQHAFNSINEALTGVYVHVAVFSPGYAESKYCLNELCSMLESQKPLIPVFYNVEPEDLRQPEVGHFAKAFTHHLERGRDQDVVRWKAALWQVAAITGFKLSDFDNDTVKLEKEIVAAILDVLPAPPPLPVARHAVGLNKSSTYVINRLQKMGDNVGVVGIYGMGGIGKTTLARKVYNHEGSSFDSRCFLKDVKNVQGVAVMDLQMKMATDLLHEDAKMKHKDFAYWFEKIQKRKVLLVIDDINKRQQFDELIPDLNMLAPGSRVLITSRERDILKSIISDVSEGLLYLVPELSFADSLDLFLWCAFRTNNIAALAALDASFDKWVKEITRACCGLPLALEVMGGFLADKKNFPEDGKYWREAISALRKNGDIITSLQISYDGLASEDDKHMFLDIACFMLGHSEEVAMEVWKSSGDYDSTNWSLNRLIAKCLVKIDGHGNLSMHDLLRDMGRNIVIHRASYKVEMRSHIWDSLSATKLLQKQQDSHELLALSVVGVDPAKACKAEQYAKMVELRYLLLDDYQVNGDFSGWSKELRLLQWRYYCHREFPRSLKLPNLAVLDLAGSDCLTRVWARDLELEVPFGDLRMLILSNCTNLKELPQHLDKLQNLKCLKLNGCCSLTVLPDSLGDLPELEYLDLSHCVRLSNFPNKIRNLLKLKEILVVGCTELKKLPTEFGRLKRLGILKATRSGLRELPESFGQLQNLTEADFGDCTQLQRLSESFGCLGNLWKLSLKGFRSLIQLPEYFLGLSSLENLNLYGCKQLHKLPPSVGRLRKLKVLDLQVTGLKELPESFGQLQSLTEVDFGDCTQLQRLCEDFGCLGNLRKLSLQYCSSLSHLPESFSGLSNLENLNMTGCKRLQKLPCTIGGLLKLRLLSMSGTGLKELPKDFGQLRSLERVDLDGCTQLGHLCEGFGWLGNLQELNLYGCESLTRLPASFCGLQELRVLSMSGSGLEQLPKNFGQLQSLTKVDFDGCTELQHLSEDFGCLGNLRKLNVEDCSGLIQLPESFSELFNLEDLNLSGCKQLRKLLPFSGLRQLNVLNMRSTAVEELPEDFGQLQSLKKADFGDCTKLQNLCEDFGCLGNLRKLNLEDCSGLIRLPESFSDLSNLEHLNLSGCKQLRKLPHSVRGLQKLKVLCMRSTAVEELPEDFGHLQSLKEIDFGYCSQLQNVCASFGYLGSLRKLNLSTCKSLTKHSFLDSFSDLSKLKELDLSRCGLLLQFPPPICRLKMLSLLRIDNTALWELPEDFGQLQNLTMADFSFCKQLQSLGESFGCLGKLRELNLRGCSSLIQLPESFSNLSNLKELDLRDCTLYQMYPLSTERLRVIT